MTDDSENPLYCWGRNDHGQLGNGSLSPSEPFPGGVKDLIPYIKAISAGALHTCATAQLPSSPFGSFTFCWGNNRNLELGPHEGKQVVPEPDRAWVFFANVIDSGAQHTCALLIEGTVTCWGANEQVQLGSQVGAIDLGVTIHQREWEYAGPTLVSGCEDLEHGSGFCWKDVGADATKISVEVKESGTSCPPPSLGDCTSGDESLTVAGLVTFLDVSDKPLGSKSFCGKGRFAIPSGTESLSIELYEGAADAPVSLQRACTISTPISGTTTITLTGRCRQLLCVVLEGLPGT